MSSVFFRFVESLRVMVFRRFVILLTSFIAILIKIHVFKVIKSNVCRIFIQNFDFVECLYNEKSNFRMFFFMKKFKIKSVIFRLFRNSEIIFFSFFDFLKKFDFFSKNKKYAQTHLLESVILHLFSSSNLT